MATVDVVIVGQGLAGSCLAWNLHWAGQQVLLIDRNEPATASKTAAGLLTPITGQRMAAVPYYRQSLAAATSFYRRIEQELAIEILDVRPAIRLFQNESERNDYQRNRSKLAETQEEIDEATGELRGFQMQDAARLDVRKFLTATQAYFAKRDEYAVSDLNLDEDLKMDGAAVEVASLNVTGMAIALCQGWQPVKSRWFPGYPDGPSKGEILRVRLGNSNEQRVVHKGIWLVPENSEPGGRSYLLGATYDRSDLNNQPTTAGREELLDGLKQLTDELPEVLEHTAAVRAGMKRRKPVFGQHPEEKRVYLLNGLGSRGALLAPIAAQALTDLILGRPGTEDLSEIMDILPQALDGEQGVNSARKQKSLTQLAHNVIGRVVQPGDTVVDATAGNGHDTLKLSALVGTTGRVIAIDVQPEAISQTAARLTSAGLSAELRLGDHAVELEDLVAAGIRVKAVMFNLGYLPGREKNVTTSVTSTRAALLAASRLLEPGGVITVVAYRGHAGGQEETSGVERWIAELPPEQFETSRIEGDSLKAASPVLFIIRVNRLD